jgi:formate dehydrogenase major subunit
VWASVLRGVESYSAAVGVQSEARRLSYYPTIECVLAQEIGQIQAIFGTRPTMDALAGVISTAARYGYVGLKTKTAPCGGYQAYVAGFTSKAQADDSEETQGQRDSAAGLQHEAHGIQVEGKPRRDETLQHPRCVYQVLRRHFARYTPEVVERTCGISQADFLEVCRAWTENSGRERTTALVYSVGWTQHSVGVQYIRTGAILQLLLGNMGRPGGGVMALRGHASIQGSTDIPTLFNILPGYLPMPNPDQHATLTDYVDSIRNPGSKGFWSKADAYMVSLLKAYWGDAATAANDWGYDWLPRLTGDHGTY